MDQSAKFCHSQSESGFTLRARPILPPGTFPVEKNFFLGRLKRVAEYMGNKDNAGHPTEDYKLHSACTL